MKKSTITESQIVNAIKEYEAGKHSTDICRELGIHKATFYNWKKKYSGIFETAKGTGGREPKAEAYVC